MMVRVWEYEVATGSVAEFESAYGTDGDWAQLFASEPGFRGTTLYQSVSAPERYLTVDVFTDGAAWERLLRNRGDAYERLDARTAHLTSRETELVAADTGAGGGSR
jgi:heme-degrading monooxygenase HmoA